MTLALTIIMAIAFSFLASKSSYYILKFLAGAAWVACGLVWAKIPPDGAPTGSAVNTIVMLLFFIFGIAFMFYPFWRTNGESLGKITPFWRSQEDEDDLENARRFRTRSERTEAYEKRVKNALNGRR